MLPLAKAAVLAVLLGGGTVGAYALTGGFGSGSGNGNETTAQEGTSENNALPSQPAPADTPPKGPVGDGDARVESPVEDATQQLSTQVQETQKDSGAAASDPKPAEDERTQDTPVVQNTVGGKNPADAAATQNVTGPNAASVGGAGVQQPRGEEAEVTLGEEKSGSPSGEGGDNHSA